MRTDLNTKKIALTGAGGFLGSHLLPLLKESGAVVRCLSRRGKLPGADETIKGDCRDFTAMKDLLAGQEIFVHIAALLFGSSWQDYFGENTKAVRQIIRALQSQTPQERPKKIIFVSSLAAAGPCAILPGKRENEEPAPVSAYGWSKLWCEQALAMAPVQTLTILRPPIIYGSGDKGLLPLFKSVKKGFGVSPGTFRKFPVSVIHAKDAAKALAMACEQDLPGIFHLSDGRPCTMDDFCQAAAQALLKKKCRVLHMPLPLMAVSAQLSGIACNLYGGICKKLGKSPPPPPHWNMDKYLESAQAGWLADGSIFQEKTGFKPDIDLADGMEETVKGYQARGWL